MSTPQQPQSPADAQDDDARDDEQQQGQVSEVSGMDPAQKETPISPGDATAGYPDSESGHPDEGSAGPETSEPENHRDRQV